MAVLGPPDYRWEQGGLIFRRPRQWVYGTTIDFRKFIIPEWPIPFPIPIKLRLFRTADDEDLVIDWTSDDVVAKVSRPTGKLE